MSSVVEIEQAIAKLSREQFLELARWFDEERNRMWDQQIEEDARTGKLREAYKKLANENDSQPAIPLDDFLGDGKFS